MLYQVFLLHEIKEDKKYTCCIFWVLEIYDL